MSDLIRREDAIEAIERIFDRCEEIENHLPKDYPDRTDYKMFPDYMTVWKYLHQLPFVEPKGQTAKVKSKHYYGTTTNTVGCITCIGKCGNCDCEVNKHYAYCPVCGYRLEWE